MAKIFITGSSTGLGALAAKELIKQGNEVVLHARNESRAKGALKENPKASDVIIGDLANKEEVRSIAEQVNQLGKFDVIIHNAGIINATSQVTSAVNIEAPYMLTSLIRKPKRLIYISSSMHNGSNLSINRMEKTLDYSSSKLALLLLTQYVARLWSDVIVTAVNPGWVPTKMGGKSASDDLREGYMSQVWLATGEDKKAKRTGKYYYHRSLANYDKRVDDIDLQNELIKKLEQLTEIKLED